MRLTKQIEIDGMRFSVQQLGGKAAGKLFVRLNSYLLPAIGQGLGLFEKVSLSAGLSTDLDLGAVGRGLSLAANTLFEKLTPEEYESLLGQFLETARVQVAGKDLPLWPNFDDLMAGKVFTQIKLLAFSLEVNYQDFFDALGGKEKLGAVFQSKISSISNPIGLAGA